MEKLVGSVEAGGTKLVVAVADFDFNVKTYIDSGDDT